MEINRHNKRNRRLDNRRQKSNGSGSDRNSRGLWCNYCDCCKVQRGKKCLVCRNRRKYKL